MIARAFAGPIPGRTPSCFLLAVLIFTCSPGTSFVGGAAFFSLGGETFRAEDRSFPAFDVVLAFPAILPTAAVLIEALPCTVLPEVGAVIATASLVLVGGVESVGGAVPPSWA